ncbi:hypothetical protein BDF20DRAFT_917275 [Mycotypha africana]|uniref:uncharacterized protein n=1 Tax=Mycotypha africana TaxID=64632 RepID=UPI002300AB2C|nr:uncharacterized protein BDF20DRAFT_917275 [Mycotypha africana]KAI8968052.1 hypothetical protein BDF20DRAFT_917275 [Mycotypha africana]
MSSSQQPDDDPYGAIKFGEFRKYMQNKKSKLKKQEKELKEQASQDLPQIFSGTSIYINGYCDPPATELRRLILQHGGDYQHYLKKLSVTHIVATNLTNSKLQEFRAYKVVRPNWIVESINAKQLLPWQNYRLASKCSGQTELPFQPKAIAPLPQPHIQPDEQQSPSEQNNQIVNKIPDLQQQTSLCNLNAKPATTGEALNADLLSNKWAREVSTVNPAFIKRYYETSRLHYLSTWKHEIKKIVEALELNNVKSLNRSPFTGAAENKKRKHPSSPRVIMHIDFDCFFASVGIKDRPHLNDKPVAVTHSRTASETSKSDIASCNYVARSYGIYNGMHIGTAKRLCPDLQVIPYEFEKYKAVSTKFYEVILQYANKLQAVSVDEALIDVSSRITTAFEDSQKEIEELATKIRDDIRNATGCEVSIGIGPNILVARMSTRKAKPAGQYMCKTDEDIEHLLDNQQVGDLPGVGFAIAEKLKQLKNVESIGDLKKVPLYELQSKVGEKMGQTLYNFARGIDERPLTTHQERRSVSAEVNWGVRFENEENQKAFVEGLAVEVSSRLRKYNVKGKSITLKILKRKQEAGETEKLLAHGMVDAFSKSYNLNNYTDDAEIIRKHVHNMLKSFHFHYADIRGLGIHISRLNNRETLPSANQGRLDFMKSLSPNRHVTSETEPQSKDLTSQASRRKETMEVSIHIFKELPESVQQELKAAYNIQYTESKSEEEERRNNVDISEAAQPTSIHKLGSDASTSMSISSAELPPWSQLDPGSLLAFPEKTRIQILKYYGEKNEKMVTENKELDKHLTTTGAAATGSSKPTTATFGPWSPQPTKTPKTSGERPKVTTPKSSSGSNKTPRLVRRSKVNKSNASTITITQLFQSGGGSPSAQRVIGSPSAGAIRSPSFRQPNNGRFYSVFGIPSVREATEEEDGYDLSFDTDVLNELPKEMRAEVLQDYRTVKKAKVKNNEDTRLNYTNEFVTVKRVDLPRAKEPALQDTAYIGDVRELLNQWVHSYEEGPEDGDVETIKHYLIELVQYPDLEKVQLLIMYLQYLIRNHLSSSSACLWNTVVQDLQNVVNDKVTASYGCPLKF